MRLVIVLVLVLAAAGCGAKVEPKAPPPPREVEIYVVQPNPVRETGEYLGSLISRQSVNISPQVAGYIRRILVKPGEQVAAGQPLLTIDARQETAAVESAEASAVSAEAALDLAKQTLARTEELYREGIASAQELERARSAVATSDASLKAARAQVDLRKVTLQYYDVKAPFAGFAGDVRARIGDYVNATTVLTSVAESDALEIGVGLPADRARSVRVGTPIEVIDRTGKVLIDTQVYFIAPEADPRTQLVEVKAAFRNTVGLRPSELVPARVVYGTRSALVVPALAIIRQSGQPFVFMVLEKDGKTIVSRRPVKLGALGDRNYVVEGGLEPGEKIAVSSLQLLRDGMQVRGK